MDLQAHEAALRSAVQKPPASAKAWRTGPGAGASAPPPPPPKVYRVEPREFRDLVQRLTGAPPAAVRPQQHHGHRMGMAAPVQPQPVRAGEQQQVYGAAGAAPWFSFPMAGVEAHQQQRGAFL